MNVRDAAIKVLQEAGEPLHAKESTARILARKLWKSGGKTPHATVSAHIYADIKKNGQKSPFVRTYPGTFSLRDTIQNDQPISGGQEKKPIGLSFLDAAKEVLERSADKRPMHYKELTKQALGMGLLRTGGRTPEATMGAQLYTHIKRAERRGERPRFVQHAQGVFGLSRWMGSGLSFQIEQHNRQIRKELLKRLKKMPPEEFEGLIGELLAAIGFDEVEVTARTGDGGIDVRGTLVIGDVIRIQMAVQVKRWERNVQAGVVRDVRDSLGVHEHGLLITTSSFSPAAEQESRRHDAVPVALMKGKQLVRLLIEHGIGITRQPHDLIELAGTVGGTQGADTCG